MIAEQITDLIPYFPRLRGDFELICEVLAAPPARGKPLAEGACLRLLSPPVSRS